MFITVASKVAQLFRRYPVAVFLLLVALTIVAAWCGHPRPGLWDGPI